MKWSLGNWGLSGHWGVVIGHSHKWLTKDKGRVLLSALLAFVLSFSPVLPSLAPIKLFGNPSAQASVVTWDGEGQNNLWSNPENWSDNTVPTPDDLAIFDSTSSKNVAIDGPVAA